MLRIWVRGGLGNQLFQFSLYYYLRQQGKKACLYIQDFDRYNKHNGFELDKIFNLEIDICKNNSFPRIRNRIRQQFMNFNNFLIRNYGILFPFGAIMEFRNQNLNQLIYKTDNRFLMGYWQKETYLSDIRDELISTLVFRAKNESPWDNLVSSHSTVLIHIRGGDYRELSWMLKREYYLNAIDEANKYLIGKARYLVITDDLDRLDDLNLPIKYTLVDQYYGDLAYINMQLMTRAKNLIIANSSFSWWGAYLNNNDANVFVPNYWIQSEGYERIHYLESWNIIDY
jgi:hypothetical protein